MRPDTAAHPSQSSAAQRPQPQPWETAEPVFLAWDNDKYTRAQASSPAAEAHANLNSATQRPQPQLQRPQRTPAIRSAAGAHAQPNSAAQPVGATARSSEEERRIAAQERRIAARMDELQELFDENRRLRRGPLWEPKVKRPLKWQWESEWP